MTIETDELSGVSLEEFLAIFLAGFEQAIEVDFKETSRTAIESPPGYLVEGQATSEGVVVLIKFVITLNGDYGIAFGSFVVQPLFELHQPILDRMLDSIQTFPPPPPTADDYGNSPGTATDLAPGESVTGSIDSVVDVDYFTFSGAAGKTYMAEIELGSLNNALLVLESDGGTCILNGSVDFNNTGAPLFRWPVPNDGTYYLRVENADGISTGGYTLHLSETMDAPTDDHGNDFCAATAINVADELPGTINEPLEVDWFMFSAEAGTTYIIVVTLGTLGDSLLVLWDTDGDTILDSNDDFGSTLASRIQWTAPESGIYFLHVQNADGVSVGTYIVTVMVEP